LALTYRPLNHLALSVASQTATPPCNRFSIKLDVNIREEKGY
jgi:hypothetical protein